MSEIQRHSGALYTPPDEHPPPPTLPRWTRQRSSSLSSRRSSRKTAREVIVGRANRLHRWARKRVKKMTLMQKILGTLALLFVGTTTILGLVFHTQILHAILPFAEKLRLVNCCCLCCFMRRVLFYTEGVVYTGGAVYTEGAVL
jgi:hypothetical protein